MSAVVCISSGLWRFVLSMFVNHKHATCACVPSARLNVFGLCVPAHVLPSTMSVTTSFNIGAVIGAMYAYSHPVYRSQGWKRLLMALNGGFVNIASDSSAMAVTSPVSKEPLPTRFVYGMLFESTMSPGRIVNMRPRGVSVSNSPASVLSPL